MVSNLRVCWNIKSSAVPSAPGKRSGAQITAKLHTTCDNLIIVNTLWEVVVDDDDDGGGDDAATDTDTDTAHIDDSKANSQTKNDGFMADEWLVSPCFRLSWGPCQCRR